jgi:hypothetical protein
MDLDRRSFLRVAAGAAAGGIIPLHAVGVAEAQSAPTIARPGTAGLAMASFQPYVNTSFRFQVGGRSIAMPLSKVTDDRPPGTRSTGECFSLMFAGPKPAFPQGTYAVEHAGLGRFNLFVVPVGRKSTGQDYQALFNHLFG